MPKNLFFDLDHTIWDFDANADQTLLELYDLYGLMNFSNHTSLEFVEIYKRINEELWEQYRQHKIEKSVLRWKRFTDTFIEMGMRDEDVPRDIWDRYLDICPTKTKLMPGAIETLDYLSGRYDLHLITNGFAETQKRKLKHSDLEKYFKSLTISEEVGVQKPHPDIFKAALKNAGSTATKSRYIGDNIEADVKGGINSGWQVFWYNPNREIAKISQELMDYYTEINHLQELKEHL